MFSEKFLRKIKLVEDFQIEIEMPKDEFLKKLPYLVEPSDLGIFSHAFEQFSSSRTIYKGQVFPDFFRIRRRRRMFDTSLNLALAEGILKAHGDNTLIDVKVTGLNGFYKFFPILILGVEAIFLLTFLVSDMPTILIGFMLFQTTLFFSIFYFIMRRGTKAMRYELERDFYFLKKR
ncbi:MAG: hypothetical protein EOO50_15870 [Flavobacterium sp.]|uniref:hypothetical protein n=1 Tax=Flavobacterium sp. TaxID=239 RepID=UPI001215B053|nr:hypothetical protein [Flavobacterium sp.]RZJ64375.1 MAG: hypothetical protein EOO50_15870 [Flavobacterium sp.]